MGTSISISSTAAGVWATTVATGALTLSEPARTRVRCAEASSGGVTGEGGSDSFRGFVFFRGVPPGIAGAAAAAAVAVGALPIIVHPSSSDILMVRLDVSPRVRGVVDVFVCVGGRGDALGELGRNSERQVPITPRWPDRSVLWHGRIPHERATRGSDG